MGHIQPYQSLQQAIIESRDLLQINELPPSAVKASIQTIDDIFRTQILPTAREVEALYGIQVEINKQLRLLKTDCLFLQSAKQIAKQQQRLSQIRDRLGMLEQYCAMALNASTSP